MIQQKTLRFSGWKKYICLTPFWKQFESDKNIDAFASSVKDYLDEFLNNVSKFTEDEEYFKDELQEVIDYFEVHSEDGNLNEVDYNIDELYSIGNIYRIVIQTEYCSIGTHSIEKVNKAIKDFQNQVGILPCIGCKKVIPPDNTNCPHCGRHIQVTSNLEYINTINGFDSKILSQHKEVINT